MKNDFLAGLSVFLFCLTLTLFIFSWQIKTLANPLFLKSVLNDAKVYDQISTLGNNLNVKTADDFNFVALVKTFTKSIDKTLAKKQIESFIDNFYLYLLDKTDQNSVAIDLREIKNNLNSKWPVLAPQIFSEEYQKLPACTTENVTKEGLLKSSQIKCQSNAISSGDFSEIIRLANLSAFNKSIPDRITLQDLLKQNSYNLNNIKNFLRFIFILYPVSLVFLIISLIGIVMFSWPDFRSILAKIGWSTFIITFPTFIILFFTDTGAKFLKALTEAPEANKLSAIFAPLISALSKNLITAIIKLPLILCIISICLLILVIFIPKIETKVIPSGFESKPK